MGSLSIHQGKTGVSGLETFGALALPIRIESAAFAAPVGDDLVILINRPGTSETRQLRIRPRAAGRLSQYQMEELLPPLPTVAAGASDCRQELLVTGADRAGQAMVLGAMSLGQVAWQFALPGPPPTRWPVPGCAWDPVVVWQDSRGLLAVATFSSSGISHRRSIPTGGPPVSVCIGAGAVWAAWTEAAGIAVVEIREQGTRTLRIAAAFTSDVALGASAVQAYITWTQAGATFLARVGSQALPAEPPVALDLGHARGGRMAVIPGPEPLVWAQRGDFIEGESQQWTSSLVLPGRAPLTINALVHAVTWWGDQVAVVGTEEIYFLKWTAS